MDKVPADAFADPQARIKRLDFSTSKDREHGVDLLHVLVERFILPNREVGTENYRDEDPPGGYHFIPERWVGGDEDIALDVIDILGRCQFPLDSQPDVDRLVKTLSQVEGLETPTPELARKLFRSWVADSAQASAEYILLRLGNPDYQAADSERSRTEFTRIAPLLQLDLPRKLLGYLVIALFELSTELGVELAKHEHPAFVAHRLRVASI